MRLYTFNHVYLSPIQHGIQTAHVVAEMFAMYRGKDYSSQMLMDWAQNHKTIICLKGGNSASLIDIHDKLKYYLESLGLPWAAFQEDDESLNGSITCVGVVLPKRIYEYDPDNTWEGELSLDEICVHSLIYGRSLA